VSTTRKLAILAVAVTAAVAATAAGSAAGRDGPGAPAQVVDYEPPVRMESYRVTDFGRSRSARDDRTSKARFRVIENTGNCCENYITIDSTGRLFDLGGRYINFTDDNGKTWKSVQSLEPLVNGEGAIAVAPGGDIVGIEWDPYSGDHLLSYRYTAKTETWEFLETTLHTPFYDRPWLTVVPGPFSIGGTDVPYVSYVDGYPHRATYLYSTDGLTYIETSNPFIDHTSEAPVERWIKTSKESDLTWDLPNSNSPITPLGGSSALARPGPFASSWSVLNPDTQEWSPMALPDGSQLDGGVLVDSKGRIHNLLGQGQMFDYRISSDGGRTWKSLRVDLPPGHSISDQDFRVNAELGIAAVVIHAEKEQSDADLLYKFDVSGKPRLDRLYEVGLGDTDAAAGVGQNIRMDFQTVAIFPDGRLAVSFLDSTTGPVYSLTSTVEDRLGPALAIEL
jgi:hypothetical protein